ncbi:hypothetical protein NKH77_14330 [Streptomyces sp. M19]
MGGGARGCRGPARPPVEHVEPAEPAEHVEPVPARSATIGGMFAHPINTWWWPARPAAH